MLTSAPDAICASPYGLGSATTGARHPSGEKPWPPVGRKHGRQWGHSVAASGEKPMALDKGFALLACEGLGRVLTTTPGKLSLPANADQDG